MFYIAAYIIIFGAALFAAATSDDTSYLIPETLLGRAEEVGHPLLLADFANEGLASSSFVDLEATRRPTRIIPAGGVCRTGKICKNGYCRALDVCEGGYFCSNGRCRARSYRRTFIPAGGTCRPGIDVCVAEYICLNSKCSAPGWFTRNDQYCVMDCPSIDSPCCEGFAQSWDHVFSSAEECCSQSSFQGNYDRCLSQSLQCNFG